MNSTSSHTLNADRGLGRGARRLWLALNWLNNNWFPNRTDPRLVIREFVPDVCETCWRQTSVKSSPSRRLSDLFWMQLPWAAFEKELRVINVFDTGCGSGDYASRLNAYAGGRIATYTGVDLSAHCNWTTHRRQNPQLTFHQADAVNVAALIPPDADMFISQSATEHFAQDLRYFEEIRDYASRKTTAVIQVHLMPSSACLKLYRFHGVRQYTPRTISHVTRIFDDRSYFTLYRLGGNECNRLHWQFITRPLRAVGQDLRDTQTGHYERRLHEAIVADSRIGPREPTFYALVIHSNWTEMILR